MKKKKKKALLVKGSSFEGDQRARVEVLDEEVRQVTGGQVVEEHFEVDALFNWRTGVMCSRDLGG